MPVMLVYKIARRLKIAWPDFKHFLASQITLSKHFHEFLMPIQALEPSLTLCFQSSVECLVLIVQPHVDVMP